MSTFVLIHGAGDVGWYWHLVEAELRARGHDVVAPDLPGDDDSLELRTTPTRWSPPSATAGTWSSSAIVRRVHRAAGRRPAPGRCPGVRGRHGPGPGEAPGDWWERTGYRQAVEEQAARDGGVTGSDDPYVCYYHDVPRELATLAMSKERAHPSQASMASPWPLDALPDVPTRFVLCTEDRFFPAAFLRRVVAERLGIVPDEIAAGHCVALSRPLSSPTSSRATPPRVLKSARL